VEGVLVGREKGHEFVPGMERGGKAVQKQDVAAAASGYAAMDPVV